MTMRQKSEISDESLPNDSTDDPYATEDLTFWEIMFILITLVTGHIVLVGITIYVLYRFRVF